MEIQSLMNIMNLKYQELRRNEFSEHKKMLIQEIRDLETQITSLIRLDLSSKHSLRRLHIGDIMEACRAVEISIESQEAPSQSYSFQYLARCTLQLAVQKTLSSSQIQCDSKQVEELVDKAQKIVGIMQKIKSLVNDNGQDLDRIEQNMDIAFIDGKQANKQLGEAKQLMHQTLLTEIRLAIYGFFSILGFKILGLPGMLGGFLFGWKLI